MYRGGQTDSRSETNNMECPTSRGNYTFALHVFPSGTCLNNVSIRWYIYLENDQNI